MEYENSREIKKIEEFLKNHGPLKYNNLENFTVEDFKEFIKSIELICDEKKSDFILKEIIIAMKKRLNIN